MDQVLKPEISAEVINLLINTYDLTHEAKYFARIQFFGNMGIDLFLGNGNPLPKASNRNSQYESITGRPDFALALLKLHLDFNTNRMKLEILAIQKGEPFTKDIDPLGHLNYFTPENFKFYRKRLDFRLFLIRTQQTSRLLI